jgi:hypothetical protein
MSWIKDAIAESKQHSLKRSKQKQFGMLLLALLLGALAFAIWKNGLVFNEKQWILAACTIPVLAITLFYSKIFYPVLLVWLFIGNILGVISSFIILVLIYFSIITPIALILRLTKNERTKKIGWIAKKNILDYRKLS